MVAADVPLPVKAMPAPSVTKVKLTEATTVAVTATVPVADVALADGAANAAIASTNPVDKSTFLTFIRNLRFGQFLDSAQVSGERAEFPCGYDSGIGLPLARKDSSLCNQT